MEPHFTYRPPKDHIYEYVDEEYSIRELNEHLQQDLMVATLCQQSISDESREVLIDLYDASIRYLDDQLRQFYKYLKRQGLAKNTIFVVFADHGELFGERGRWGHGGRVHSGLARVPLIIKYPDGRSGVESSPVEVRTLCEHLIADADRGAPNRVGSKSPAIVEDYGLDVASDLGLWDRYDGDSEKWDVYQAGVFTTDWKLTWDANGNVEFRRLMSGSTESEDKSGEHSAMVSELKEEIAIRAGEPQELHRKYRESESGELDADARDRLSDLGYI
jgi:hypothetical protein